MNLRNTSLLLGLVSAVGSVVGAAWPPPPLPKNMQQEAPWSLPSAERVKRHSPQDANTALSDMHWLQDGAAGIESATSSWRFLGVLNERTSAILISSTSGQGEVSRINVGERLPDGSTLESVQGDKATTQLDRCITTYQLFIEQPIEQSDGCETADTTATAQGSDT
jgi:hypothetical protein